MLEAAGARVSRPSVWRKKPIAELVAHTEGEGGLRRALGPVSLTALGIGAIIGSGIFVMTGRVAAEDAGPAVALSFIVAGLACALAALCYAELASMVPVAGSAFTYAQAALGEIFAWMIGWDLILEYAMSGACIASSWTHYLDELLRVSVGVRVPPALASDPFSTPGALINLPAVLIILLVTALLVVGIKESARANAGMVVVKVAVVLFVIAVGAVFVSKANIFDIPADARKPVEDAAAKWGMFSKLGIDRALVSIDNSTRSSFVPYGLSGVMLGASIVFFAYLGFDCVSTHAEEALKPRRDIPIAILASLVICTVLYVAVAWVLVGMDPYPTIDTHAAAASAFRKRAEASGGSVFLRGAAFLIALGALAGMTSVLLVTFLGQARIFLAMARDGLLPQSVFGAVHPRFKTPHRSTILTGVVSALVAGFTPITKLEEMVNIGTLLAFSVVCIAVLVLRKTRPEEARSFRTPVVWIVAPLGVTVNLIMMMFLPVDTWIRLVVWMAIGFAIYFGTRKFSRQRQT